MTYMLARLAPRVELPIELIAIILNELALDDDVDDGELRATLLSCRLVSQTLYACATELLFRDFTATFEDSPELRATYRPLARDVKDDGWTCAQKIGDALAWAEMESYLDLNNSADVRDDGMGIVHSADWALGSRASYDVKVMGDELLRRSAWVTHPSPSDVPMDVDPPSSEGEDKMDFDSDARPLKTFTGLYDFLLASPHLCRHVRRLTLKRKAAFGAEEDWDPRGDIPESLLLAICSLLPSLEDLTLSHLLPRCDNLQGPLPNRQLSLDVLRLDMTRRRLCSDMLSPLRLLRDLNHLLIGPLREYSGDYCDLGRDSTKLLLPTVSPTLSLTTLLFEDNHVVHKFLEALEERKSICARVRHLRVAHFDVPDLEYVQRFINAHQDSLTSLSIDLDFLRNFGDPLEDDETFERELERAFGTAMKRIKSIAFIDRFFHVSHHEPFCRESVENVEISWILIQQILSLFADSEQLETITVMADGSRWPIPPKAYMPKLSDTLEDTLAVIDELPFPSLKGFALVSDAPRSSYEKAVETALPGLWRRRAIAIEEGDRSEIEAQLFNTPVM